MKDMAKLAWIHAGVNIEHQVGGLPIGNKAVFAAAWNEITVASGLARAGCARIPGPVPTPRRSIRFADQG